MAPCSAARACSSRALPRASAALVIGSSRNPGHRQRLKEYGADLAIDNGDARWVDQVLQATGGKGVDLVIDRFQEISSTPRKKRPPFADVDFNLHALRRIQYL